MKPEKLYPLYLTSREYFLILSGIQHNKPEQISTVILGKFSKEKQTKTKQNNTQSPC